MASAPDARLRGKPTESRPGGHAAPAHDRSRTYFILVVAIAAALRLAYTLGSRTSPFFDHLDLDTKFYDSWARRIAAGDWIGRDVFFMGPLYPYFLGMVYKMLGPSLLAAKLVQSLAGSLTAGVVYLLGRRVFGAGVGLVAGLVAALYVPFIFTDTLLLFPVLATLLNALMLYFLYRGLARKARGGVPSDFLVAGVFCGLSAAGNASVLAFAPLAVGFVLVYGGLPPAERMRRAAAVVAGIALVVVPITLRNYAVGRDFVPLTSNAGINFFIGNSAKATGAYVKPDGLDIYTDPEGRAIAERAVGHSLKPSEVSAWWTGRATSYIKAHPGAFAHNLARKVFFFWSVYEIPQIEHLPFERQYSWVLRLPTPSFGIVCPLGIVGLVLAVRRRKEAWLLALFALAYPAAIIAFFVVARYRLPMVPALAVFAAYAALWMAAAARERRWRPLAWAAAGFVALFVLVHVNFYRIHPLNGFAQSYYRLGIIHEAKANLAAAEANYRKALEMDPAIVPAHVNLGILLSRQGRFDAALVELKDAVARDPEYDKALYNLGLVYADLGATDSALVMLDRALAVNPAYGLARLAKTAALYEVGDLDEAGRELEALRGDATLSGPSRAQIDFLLRFLPDRKAWVAGRGSGRERESDRYLLRADNLASLGLTARALAAYLEAVAADSANAPALFQVGTARFDAGAFAEAATVFQRLLRVAPGYKGAHFALGVAAYRAGDVGLATSEFEAELRLDPASANAHINLAMLYEERLKNLRLAADHLRRYIELTGGTDELRNHLKELEARVSGSDDGRQR
jgi:tetratricopeptide (TPR) repeat protein